MNKIYSLLLVFIVSLLCFNSLSAQSTEELDVLVLRSGDIIKGTIVELKPDDYVVIDVNNSGETTTYKMDLVAQLRQLDNTTGELDFEVEGVKRKRVKPTYEFVETGRFTAINFGFSFGKRTRDVDVFDPFIPGGGQTLTEQTAIGFNLQTIVGHQFSRKFGLGGGISYDAYNLEDGESLITLLGHCRGYLSEKVISPYWAVSAGYGFALLNETQGVNEAKGGLMFHPELGFRLGASAKTNFTLSLGYRFQSAEYIQEFPFNGDIEYRNIDYRRFLFSVGLLF